MKADCRSLSNKVLIKSDHNSAVLINSTQTFGLRPMKLEIQDQVIEALKAYAMASGANSEDSWTASLALVRARTKGIDLADSGVRVASLMLMRPMLDELPNPEIAEAIIRRAPKVDEKLVRQELESLTDDEGISMRNDFRDLAKYGPAALSRAMKAASATIESPPGQLPVLTTNESRGACKKILDLQSKGVSLGEAKKRAAQHYGVSVPTINRVWRFRKTLLTE